jgi:hypothetical protein
MKARTFISLIIVLFVARATFAAESAKFDGEYSDRKFLNGHAVFQFSVHQSGKALDVGFDAVYNDGRGAAPDGTGAGKVSGNHAQFTWKDSFGNAGMGTIVLAERDVVVSMKSIHVAEPRCVVFYRDNMRLKRMK